MQERRSEIRMLCADMVQACWQDQEGKPHRANALLEDISHSGACLQMEAPIPLGITLSWESHRKDFSGHVRYCVYREIGFFVGVEFDPQSKWSKEAYKPKHLLDLQKLVSVSRK